MLDQATNLYKALAHPARLRILAMLDPGDLCACQITAVLGLAPSTVSAHLGDLKRGRLVSERKEGRWVHYGLSRDPDTRALFESISRRIKRDPQVRADAKVLKQLRRVPVEDLCSAGLDLQAVLTTRARGTKTSEVRNDGWR